MAFAPVGPDGAALQALRGAGLRVTTPRLAMLSWLAEHPHSTADAIGAGVATVGGCFPALLCEVGFRHDIDDVQ